jgi:hypothetical protein
MPWLRLVLLATKLGQPLGMFLGLLGQLESDRPGWSLRGGLVKCQIIAHFPAFFPKKRRQEDAASQNLGYDGPEPGAPRRAGDLGRMALFGQQVPPELDVAVLDRRQLAVQVGPVHISFNTG